MKNTQRGITLIALVITIIVMLILVGVSISMAVNGGLFQKAAEAGQKTNNAVLAEQALSNGAINVAGETFESIDQYLTDLADPLKGTWVFNAGEEVVLTSQAKSSTFSVNITYNSIEYVKLIVADNRTYGGVIDVYLAVNGDDPSKRVFLTSSNWKSDLSSITITDKYDASAHADFLAFLQANATKQ